MSRSGTGAGVAKALHEIAAIPIWLRASEAAATDLPETSSPTISMKRRQINERAILGSSQDFYNAKRLGKSSYDVVAIT